MDNKNYLGEAKNKIGGKSKSFINYLRNAEFSFPLAKSPQCNALTPTIKKISSNLIILAALICDNLNFIYSDNGQ